MAGRSAFSYLASNIFTMRLVALRVLIGSWAKQVFSLSALVILDLSCRLAMFLMGKRISSIVIVLFWKSNSTPRLCMVCLPIMRSYIGAWSPGLYSIMSSWRRTFLLAEYSTKEISMSPTLSVMKVPLEVPHDWGTTRFTTEMCLLDPFFMKRRSPLDPESRRTLIVLFLTYSPELTLGSGILAQSERVFLLFSIKLVQFSSNFFDLGTNLFGIRPFLNFWERLLDPRVFSSGKSALSAFWREGFPFPRLVLRNLHLFFLKMLITVTTAVTFPVFVVLLAISSAFVVSLRAVSTTLT